MKDFQKANKHIVVSNGESVRILRELQELSQDDFLFKKGMKWGKPNFDQLLEFMKHAYENDVRTSNHAFTREMVGKSAILREFALNITGDKHDNTSE